MSTIYAGPGKVYINSVSLQPEGEAGPIKINVVEDTRPRASAMLGYAGEQTASLSAEIVCRPFDNWGVLPTLYPLDLVATGGTTRGALKIGQRPHAAAVSGSTGAKVWTPDGRLYNPVLAAVTGHPSLHLGVGKPMFGDCKIACIGDPAKNLGDSGFLFAGNAITETAAADPGGALTLTDFIRGAWTGAWGTSAGFGGDGGSPIQAEEEWTIEFDVKYSPRSVQGLVRCYVLDSVRVMARVRPYGPTHTQILGAVSAHTLGQWLGSADLVLTGPGAKTITLHNAEVKGAGFDFGGTQLGTGEVGFVVGMTVTTGVANTLIAFSA